MHDSRRYRDNAAECLLAFRDSGQPSYRKLCLSLASSWLSLAHEEEVLDDLVMGYDTLRRFTHKSSFQGAGNRSGLKRKGRRA